MARFYEGKGIYQLALPYRIQCLEQTIARLGDDHPDVATSVNNLALLYYNQGRYEEAEPFLLQALELCERVLGSNHPNTVTFRNNLAYLREKMSLSKE